MIKKLPPAWRPAEEDLRSFVVPLFWLLTGFVLTQAYVRGVIFPADHLAPLPIFAPEAIILSVLLLTPARRWWVYLAVYYAAHVGDRLAFSGAPLWFATFGNVVNVVQPLIAAALVRRFVRSIELFDTVRNVAIYILCVTIAELIGSIWGASVRAIFMGAPFFLAWRGWFVGNLLAALVLTPTLVLWTTVDRRHFWAQLAQRKVEVVALSLALLIGCWLIFGTEPLGPDLAPQLLYLPVPLLLWAALRFGPRGITAALSLFTMLAIAGAANQLGPFMDLPPVTGIFELQFFLLGIGVPLFCLAVLVEERTRAQHQLAQSEERYRAVVRNFPNGAVFLFGSDLRHIFAEGQGLTELGLSREAVEGKTPEEAFPPWLLSSLQPCYLAALAGREESLDVSHAGRIHRAQALSISDGGPATGLLLMQDITRQRRAELVGAAMERERLARDLHDSVSQALFAANVTADALPQLLEKDPEAGRAALADLRRMTDAAQNEMRSLLVELRPEALTRVPLDALLRTLAASIASKTSVEVAVQLVSAPVLAPDVQLAFYRIAQEALTNITKHAGARRIEMKFDVGAGATDGTIELTLEITDDGRGFDLAEAPRSGFGLSSMQERADGIGATLSLVSGPGEGTRLQVQWVGRPPAEQLS